MTERFFELAVLLHALSAMPGVGVRRLNKMLDRLHGDESRLWGLLGAGVVDISRQMPGMDPRMAEAMERCDAETLECARRTLRAAQAQGIHPVTVADDDYPLVWKTLLEEDAPPLLYTRGDTGLFHRIGAAVVGTRAPGKTGQRNACSAAKTLVEAGYVLVSGGAPGVDTAAHDAALRAGGGTVALLPQGVATLTLSEDWKRALDEGQLLLVCETLPDAPWRTHAAVSRNRLIAAQARLVCVIEPRKQGGSVLTARHAMHLGKPILVAPTQALPASLGARPLEELAEIAEICRHAAPVAPAQQQTLL